MAKSKYIGIELPTGTGYTNVLIGLNIDKQNTVEFCNETDIELWKNGQMENPWTEVSTFKIVKGNEVVFDSNHRLIPDFKELTITKDRFLEWYFEHGTDQEKEIERHNLAENIIRQMYQVGHGSMSVNELFDNCNQDAIRAYFTEEYDMQTEEYDVELSDLPFKYEIKLV